MRLLVLGGTAFLSRAVAEEGVRRGHHVRAACRAVSGDLPAGVRHVFLDREAPDAAARLAAIEDVDAVVEVARRPSWVRAAVTALPHAHWCFVSTVSVYADEDRLEEPVAEDVDLSVDPTAYGGMKVACERVVMERAASATVVRPGLIVGPGDLSGRFTYWPLRLADPGPVLAPGDPARPTQVVDVRDVAAFVVDGAERRFSGTVDAVGSVTTLGDLLMAIGRGIGVSPDLRWADDGWLLAHDVRPWMGPRSLPLWLPEGEDLVRDPGPAAAAGLVNRPAEEVAADTLAWARRTPDVPATGLTRAEERTLVGALLGGALP